MTTTATVYVATIGERPVAAADTLEAAQAHVYAAETRYIGEDKREFRWDNPGDEPDIWRLMARRRDPVTGRGKGRFSWTVRAVHAVAAIEATTPA